MQISKLRERIGELAAASQNLEPTQELRANWQFLANRSINEFIEALPAGKAYKTIDPDELGLTLESLAAAHDPSTLIPELCRALASSGIVTASPGHLGFVPGGGLYAGALADHMAAALNVFSGDSFASPVAVHLHEEVLAWLCRMVGYDPSRAFGDITSGGSLATLTALQVARSAHGLKARDYERTTVYLSEHTHHCCAKALRTLFGDELIVRSVPLENYRLSPHALDALIRADREQGLTPWLVIGTAGTTNLGLVDPLEAIAELAAEHGLWFHIDAACGGFFALTARGQEILRGLDRADSLVLDPHKGMFLPYGCGAVLLKEGELLREALAGSGSYLQDRRGSGQRSPMDYSLELTRPFRSLRLWLSLKLHGTEPLRAALEEKLALAQYCRLRLEANPGLRVLEASDLSILAFYLESTARPEEGEQLTRSLLARLNAQGRTFLSSTQVDGRFVIRIAILSFRTHLEIIDQLLEAIARETAGLEQLASHARTLS